MTENTEVPADEFEKAFATVAAEAERSPEEVAAAAAEAARAAAAAAEDPAAKAAKEAADKKAAEDAAEAARVAAAAAEDPAAKAVREAEEKKAAEDAAEAARVAAAAALAATESPEAKAAKEAAEKKAKEDADALAASIAPYTPTEEEVAALAKFKQEFPGEYAAVEARLKGVDKTINARIHAAVQNVVNTMAPRLQAVEGTVNETAFDRHNTALRTAHTDYDAVIPKVKDWIKTLPSYAQPGAQAVYDGGTTAEVVALVAEYKKATGTSTTTATTTVPAKKKAADGDELVPVTTRRTTAAPAGSKDPNDFDGAWDELVAATAK